MTLLRPEHISDLSSERRQAIMKRSMEDISAIYEDIRAIVMDIRVRGDAVSLEHYAKLKSDITAEDLVVKPPL